MEPLRDFLIRHMGHKELSIVLADSAIQAGLTGAVGAIYGWVQSHKRFKKIKVYSKEDNIYSVFGKAVLLGATIDAAAMGLQDATGLDFTGLEQIANFRALPGAVIGSFVGYYMGTGLDRKLQEMYRRNSTH